MSGLCDRSVLRSQLLFVSGKGTKDMKLRDYYNDTQIYIRKGIIGWLGSVNIVVAATTIAGVSSGNSAFQYAMCRFNWITSALYALASHFLLTS